MDMWEHFIQDAPIPLTGVRCDRPPPGARSHASTAPWSSAPLHAAQPQGRRPGRALLSLLGVYPSGACVPGRRNCDTHRLLLRRPPCPHYLQGGRSPVPG
eukprot:6475805-Amphidinium_carterae.4